jgi:hypothetical protein
MEKRPIAGNSHARVRLQTPVVGRFPEVQDRRGAKAAYGREIVSRS